jgi:electron transfer flavoprotein alpha subunit
VSHDVLVLAEHSQGKLSDITFELLGRARAVAGAGGGRVHVALLGHPELAGELGAADAVHVADHPLLSEYHPEAYETLLVGLLKSLSPRLLLTGTSTAGMDLAAAAATRWQAAMCAYTIGLEPSGAAIVATSQIYGGKLMAEVEITADRAVVSVIGGSFPATAGQGSGSPEVVAVDTAGLAHLRSSPATLRLPEATGVDITAADLLVSVGRGIASKDNLELAQDLADALGVPLSASRPVIDQGWLPKPHQVGKSGQKVKPKAYLAFGISGAPEHLEGMRSADLIIACNTDPSAPIFDVAHYGTTADLFDLLPALTDRVGGQ